MNFSRALELLKQNKKLARTGWNGPNQWIHEQVPDENSKMGLPYIYISTIDGKLVPWLASQTDLLSEDWEVVE